ncbi:PAAR domain-containing protein [Paraburkholderia mimosarum]|uniref:PAAR domain-containing protein n=1 Tax=Paraburkholderia mimosarum TaxID=312026 RepID=UPI00056CC097|nr:PAAR domain-containing protein [Paraburkholderia mimosarum]
MSDQEKCKGTVYAFATIGARTERGGYVTSATSGLVICDLPVALVGDIVTYPDGSQAVIKDGSGSLAADRASCFALVGSTLSNGDKIVFTPWEDGESGLLVAEGETPEGLFDASYVPPPCIPGERFALYGSTTARGGVLRDPGGEWSVDGKRVKVGILGDKVHYANGTTARIISGIAIRTNPTMAQFAYVGSVLDNGDTITDSTDRKGSAWLDTWEIVTAEEMNHRGEAV